MNGTGRLWNSSERISARTSELSVLSTPAEALTLTVSLMEPTLSGKVRRTALPAVTITPCSVTDWNPGFDTVMLYVPAGMVETVKTPVSLAVASHSLRVPVLTILTSLPDAAALVVSSTVPTIVP